MSYWKARQALKYYQSIQSILEAHGGSSILDVGSADTPVAAMGDFQRRVALTLNEIPLQQRVGGVSYRFGDFLDFPAEQFAVVTCLQVLEHLDDADVGVFARKLFLHAEELVVISVPYQWPEGSCKYHKQDPVDEEKLRTWTGRAPTRQHIVTEDDHGHRRRLIAVYELHPSAPSA